MGNGEVENVELGIAASLASDPNSRFPFAHSIPNSKFNS